MDVPAKLPVLSQISFSLRYSVSTVWSLQLCVCGWYPPNVTNCPLILNVHSSIINCSWVESIQKASASTLQITIRYHCGTVDVRWQHSTIKRLVFIVFFFSFNIQKWYLFADGGGVHPQGPRSFPGLHRLGFGLNNRGYQQSTSDIYFWGTFSA